MSMSTAAVHLNAQLLIKTDEIVFRCENIFTGMMGMIVFIEKVAVSNIE